MDEDDALLLPAFEAMDAHAVPAVWDDPDVDWSSFDAVLLRATWDYSDHIERFEGWLAHVAERTILVNPAPMASWNADKTYLETLAAAGVPIVPTRFLRPTDPSADDDLGLGDRGQVVIKPARSVGSRDTARYELAADRARAVEHARQLLAAGRTVMVQPYINSVDAHGETALLFIGGRFSHAIRKGPLLVLGAAPTTALFAAETIEPRTPSPAQRDVADAVLAAVPPELGKPTYARVDLVQTGDGAAVLELELIEPSLFLAHGGDAPDRLARTVLNRLRQPMTTGSPAAG
jgi:glutathione synthase/RimK-type ligase-like ATP-grasp enzyme